MGNTERTRVEFRISRYVTVGNLIIDWKMVKEDMQTSVFEKALQLTDKRIYSQYIDGYNIFEMTERQFNKFKTLVNI